MKGLVVCGVMLLFSAVALAQPTITLAPYDPNDAIRPLDSDGGLVNGVDQFFLRATVNRNGETKYGDTNIFVQATANPTVLNPAWAPLSGCIPNLAQCTSNQNGCYCESAPANPTNEDFQLVLTFTADIYFEGGGVRVGWIDGTNPTVSVFGNVANYPSPVCEALNATYDTGQGQQPLSATQHNTVDYSPSMTELKFCAKGLKSPNFVRISKGSTVISGPITGTENCVSVDLSANANITYGTQLTLSFEESDTAGCGRNRTYPFLFSGKASVADDGLTDGEIAGIVVGCILGVLLIVLLIFVIYKKCYVKCKPDPKPVENNQERANTADTGKNQMSLPDPKPVKNNQEKASTADTGNDVEAQQNSQNQASETQGSRNGEKPNEGTTTM